MPVTWRGDVGDEMKTITGNIGSTDGPFFAPVARDARLQVGGETLLRLALMAVHEVPQDRLPTDVAGLPNSRMLLTLTSYAYAAGMLDSEEIILTIADEPQLRYLTAGQAVNETDILRFRRRNGPVLLCALRNLLNSVSGGTVSTGRAKSPLSAEERIHLAILSDSLRMDD